MIITSPNQPLNLSHAKLEGKNMKIQLHVMMGTEVTAKVYVFFYILSININKNYGIFN